MEEPKKKFPRRFSKRIDNSLQDLATMIGSNPQLQGGGSTLSTYGTMAYSQNFSLLTLNRILLTYMYAGCGILQTAIQLPVQDALSKRVEIDSDEMDNDDQKELFEFWEKNEWWGKLLDAETWKRLYGGGALLINSNQDPETPLDLKTIGNGPIELYDIDRWQLDTSVVYFEDFERVFSDTVQQNDFIYLWGKKYHRSRFIVMRNKRAPSYIRRQLRGWGMSEAERMIRDINLFLKTDDVLYEILDESKIDIYKISGFAEKLLSQGGTNAIQKRVQLANQMKSYLNALLLDAKDEFEQKSLTFTGLADVKKENRIGIAAALRIPVTKLFGLSANGLSDTDESGLENYNQMVESEIRQPLYNPIRQLMELSMYYLWGYAPNFSISWPAMRVLTEKEDTEIKAQKTQIVLDLFDRQLMTSQEAAEQIKKWKIVDIDTKAEKGLLDDYPEPRAKPGDPEKLSQEDDTGLVTKLFRNVKNMFTGGK